MNHQYRSSGSSNVTDHDALHTAMSKHYSRFVMVLALCITISYINGTLIHIFKRQQIFSVNPRYILFIHLVANDTIQLMFSFTLYILSFLLNKIHVPLCCLLIIFTIISTQNTPLNLACMAVECYIAVCLPLHHAKLCTVKKTYVLISLISVTGLLAVLPDVLALLTTEPSKFLHSRVFCLRVNIFRSPSLQKMTSLYFMVLLVIVWSTLFYTYLRILIAAKSADVNAKKARTTILLHGFQLLLCMLTYVAPVLKQFLLYLFPKYSDYSLIVCYIIIQILPRFISPIVYGLRDQKFRQCLKRYYQCAGH